MFQKGIFSVLYKHKLPRIFIGFSKVLKYVNFWLYIGTWPSLEGDKIWKKFWFSSHDLADKWHGGGTGGIVCQRNIQWDMCVPPQLLWSTVDLNSWGGTHISHKLHRLLSDWVLVEIWEILPAMPSKFETGSPRLFVAELSRPLGLPRQIWATCEACCYNKQIRWNV